MRFLAQNSSTGETVGSAATGSFEERENCFPVLGPFWGLGVPMPGISSYALDHRRDMRWEIDVPIGPKRYSN